jgi:hypothetical protein
VSRARLLPSPSGRGADLLPPDGRGVLCAGIEPRTSSSPPPSRTRSSAYPLRNRKRPRLRPSTCRPTRTIRACKCTASAIPATAISGRRESTRTFASSSIAPRRAWRWSTSTTTTPLIAGPSGGASRRIRPPAPFRSSRTGNASSRLTGQVRFSLSQTEPPRGYRSRASNITRCCRSACPRTGSPTCWRPTRTVFSISRRTSRRRPAKRCSSSPRPAR